MSMSPELLLQLAEQRCTVQEKARHGLTNRVQTLMLQMEAAERKGDVGAYGAFGLEYLDVQQALKHVEAQIAHWEFWAQLVRLELRKKK